MSPAPFILDIKDIVDEEGKIRSEFPRKGGSDVPHGRCAALRMDGTPLLEITYRQGIPHGPYVDFWSNGRLASTGHFCNGKQDGLWYFFRDDASVMETIHFVDGKEVPKVDQDETE